jgi:hypothetical protein
MPDPIREVFTSELETLAIKTETNITKLTLTIITADTHGAGTDAGVSFQIGSRVFFLENGYGHEVALEPNAPKPAHTNRPDEFERGHIDSFILEGNSGAIGLTMAELRSSEIKLFHDTKGLTSPWNVELVDLEVAHTERDVSQHYKTWKAVGWLKDKSPAVLLQARIPY